MKDLQAQRGSVPAGVLVTLTLLVTALVGCGSSDESSPQTSGCEQYFSDRAIFPEGTMHLDYAWEDQRWEADLTTSLLGTTENSFFLRGCARAPSGTVWDFQSFWFDVGPEYPYEFDIEKWAEEPKLDAQLILCDAHPCFGGSTLIEIEPTLREHTLAGRVLDYSASGAALKAEFTAENTSLFQAGRLVMTIDLSWDPKQSRGPR